jgi:hypothetical protein
MNPTRFEESINQILNTLSYTDPVKLQDIEYKEALNSQVAHSLIVRTRNEIYSISKIGIDNYSIWNIKSATFEYLNCDQLTVQQYFINLNNSRPIVSITLQDVNNPIPQNLYCVVSNPSNSKVNCNDKNLNLIAEQNISMYGLFE